MLTRNVVTLASLLLAHVCYSSYHAGHIQQFRGSRSLYAIVEDSEGRDADACCGPGSSITCMDYAPSHHVLALTLSNGAVGLFCIDPAGLHFLEGLEYSHWVRPVGSGAVLAKLSDSTQHIAVGLSSGDVLVLTL